VSREAAFLLNNLLFAGFALVVLMGTVFPLLVQALQNKQITVGEPYFERLGVPIGLALLFLMAIGPALPWRAASGELLRSRLLVPAWAGAITLVAAIALGANGIANVLAFALAAFTLTSVGRSVFVGFRSRRRAHAREGRITSGVNMVRGNPRLYGGLLVHVGVVVIACALATTSGWTTKKELNLRPGQSAVVRGHKVTYLDTQFESSAQKNTIKAHVHIDGVGSFSPAISTYPNFADGIGTPSVKSNPVHDWYVTLVSAPTSGTVTIVVQVGTLVMWLWIGGLIMALGTAVALVPMRKRRVVAREPATPVPDPEPEILVDAAT
jgi:cytochrome c-type biogenesis protein CcmF